MIGSSHFNFSHKLAPVQNIHLVGRWLGSLEKLLERCSEGSHTEYRVFMSAEPAPTPQEHIIPQVVLSCHVGDQRYFSQNFYRNLQFVFIGDSRKCHQDHQ